MLAEQRVRLLNKKTGQGFARVGAGATRQSSPVSQTSPTGSPAG